MVKKCLVCKEECYVEKRYLFQEAGFTLEYSYTCDNCFDRQTDARDDIGIRLKKLRKQAGLSRTEMANKLANFLDIDMFQNTADRKQVVKDIEKGKSGILVDIAHAYADIFDVSLDYIFGREREKIEELHFKI